MSNKSNKHLILTLFSLAICLLAASNNVRAQVPCGGYEVTAIIQTDECPPFGYPGMVPLGLNEDGWMVGSFRACVIGPNIAWLWTPEDGLVLIPMPPDTSDSTAVDICGSHIVGHHFISDDEFGAKAFLYDHSSSEFTDLGTLPGGNWSQARGINALGQITGFWGNNVTGFWKAFIWEKGEMIDIGKSIGEADSRGLGINDTGAITGWWHRKDNGDRIAFVWQDGEVASLGPIPEGFTSSGQAINDLGFVAGDGKIFLDDGETIVVQSFLWTDNQMTNLGTLPGTTFARARGINDQTRIVGYCHNQFLTDQAAFIWHDNKLSALNDLISPSETIDIRRAVGINENGQIACAAIDEFNDEVAVLLTPIDAPLGDLDGNCNVNTVDILLLFSNWGPCDTCVSCPADLDKNCAVGVSDLLILFANWG